MRDGAVLPAATDHARDNLWVERAAAGGHSGRGLNEVLHVAHALLEQVADAVGTFGEQFARVSLVVVLGVDQHAGTGAGLSIIRNA